MIRFYIAECTDIRGKYNYIKTSEYDKKVSYIGFIHVTSCITCVGSQGSCLNRRPIGQVFKHLSRALKSVKEMKPKCTIIILANSS